MRNLPQIIFFLMTISCAIFIGIWIGQNTLTPKNHNDSKNEYSENLYSLLHDKLGINSKQEKKIINIEEEFERLKSIHKGRMKTANLELAQAIKNGGYESPKIKGIVHKIHQSMGILQTLSLTHLANIKDVLSEEQNKQLEEMVIEQLHRNAGE